VRLSYDEGHTFVNEPQIYGGIAAYPDLTVLKDGTAGVLWEQGVSFTRFNLEFIESPGSVVPMVRSMQAR
jgi:hypothetical protein